jgi:hypothetical protein
MRRDRTTLALAVLCGLSIAGPRAAAQEPAAVPPAPADPTGRIIAPERVGSPVVTLEAATGRGLREQPEERDEVETDRDSFTPATTTAGRGRLIVESAYSFIDNRRAKETHSFPELILRYGLTERVELRLGWNYEVGGTGNETSGLDAGEDLVFGTSRLERESSISYGVKLGLTRQSRWLPRSALIAQASTPTSGPDNATQLAVTGAAGWELPNRWRFDTGFRWGLASEAGDRFNAWAPSAVLRVPIGERWAAHAEYFGIFTTDKEQNTTRHFISPGLHCLVTPNLEVGVRVGWGLNDQSARFFANGGFGWRY